MGVRQCETVCGADFVSRALQQEQHPSAFVYSTSLWRVIPVVLGAMLCFGCCICSVSSGRDEAGHW